MRALRKRAGLSMAELAHAMGYAGSSSIQRYESQEDWLPVPIVEKLCRALVGKGSPPIMADEVYALTNLWPINPSGAYATIPPPARIPPEFMPRDSEYAAAHTATGASQGDIPVFASAEGGPGAMIITWDPVEYIRAPEPLYNVKKAFGFFVVGDSMAPAFEQGQIALIHPTKPPNRDQDVLLVCQRDGQATAMIKRLLSWTETEYRLRQFNPPKEFSVSKRDWPEIYKIVGKYMG